MPDSRPRPQPQLKLYVADTNATSVAGGPSSAANERGRLSLLATRVANALCQYGPLVPTRDPDDDEVYVDQIEFNVTHFALLDTPGAKRTAGYSALTVDGTPHLVRSGRVFVMPGQESKVRVKYGLEVATAEDYTALRRALPALIEISKFKADRTRSKLMASAPDGRVSHIPDVRMDRVVCEHVQRLLDPLAQLLQKKLADGGAVSESLDATRGPELTTGQLTALFNEADGNAKAIERYAAQADRSLGIIAGGADVLALGSHEFPLLG